MLLNTISFDKLLYVFLYKILIRNLGKFSDGEDQLSWKLCESRSKKCSVSLCPPTLQRGIERHYQFFFFKIISSLAFCVHDFLNYSNPSQVTVAFFFSALKTYFKETFWNQLANLDPRNQTSWNRVKPSWRKTQRA